MPRCPKCSIPLCRVEVRGVPMHTCPDCGGELIEDLRLKAIERRGDPAWTESDKDDFCRLADESNKLDDVLCPRCARIMRKFLFRNYANLQVDQCPECRVYWLDPGELEKMQVLYQETRAHYAEEDWVTVEKEARALAAMDARKAELQELRSPDGRSSGVAGAFRHGRAAAAGAALGALVGMYLLDRRLGEIDDRAEALASGAAVADSAGPRNVASELRSPWPRPLAAIILALLAALVVLAIWWLLRNV